MSAPNSNTFTVQATSTDNLVFVNQPPPNVFAGTPMSPSVTVQVEDQFRHAVSNNGLSVTLSSLVAIASGATASTNSSGLATFLGITIDTTGLGLTLTATPTNTGTGVSASSPSSSFDVTILVTNSHNALSDTSSDTGSGMAR